MVDKIKIKNFGYYYHLELTYLNDEYKTYKKERELVNNLLKLFNNFNCYIDYYNSDNVFNNLKIINKKDDNKLKSIQIEKIENFSDEMFDGRYTQIYFMNKDVSWEQFQNIRKYQVLKEFKRGTLQAIFNLDHLGFVSINISPKWKKQLENIVKKALEIENN